MKKMLFAAALAAFTTGAYAQCGTPDPDPVTGSAFAYDFKANLKTIETKSTKVRSDCDPDEIVCYRVKGNRQVKGLFISCDCEGIETPGVVAFTSNASKNKIVSMEGEVEFEVLNFFGGATYSKARSAQGLFAVAFTDYYNTSDSRGYELYAAGFGTQKDGVLQSLSGQIVGAAEPAMCLISCDTPVAAIVFEPCTLTSAEDAEDVAAGTFTLKYNKKLSQVAHVSGEAAAVRQAFKNATIMEAT